MSTILNPTSNIKVLSMMQSGMNGLLFLIFLIAIIPFFLLIFYAHPAADDYCYANVFIRGDFWNNAIGEYLAWKGRYFGIFVTVLFHKSGSMIENYHYPLFTLLTLLFVSFFFFVRSLFEEKSTLYRTLFWTLALGVFFIVTMPKVSASLYWADGAFQYQVGSIFYLLSVASILKLYRNHRKPALPALLSALFIFSAIGSTEIFMISLLSLVGLIFLYKVFFLKQNRVAWSFVMLVTIASTLLLVLSPGNAIRMELQPASGQFWFALGHSLYYGGETLGSWLFNPVFLLLSALFIPMALWLVRLQGIRKNASWVRLLLILALFLGQIWVSFFATWWAGATHPPGRTLNTIYLVFLVGWFIFILEFIALLSRRQKLVYFDRLFSIPVRIVLLLATLSFILLFVTRTHIPEAYTAINGQAQEYDRIMRNRYIYINKRKQESVNKKPSVTLQRVVDLPRILVFSDITRDKKSWQNGCFASYFNLGGVARQ